MPEFNDLEKAALKKRLENFIEKIEAAQLLPISSRKKNANYNPTNLFLAVQEAQRKLANISKNKDLDIIPKWLEEQIKFFALDSLGPSLKVIPIEKNVKKGNTLSLYKSFKDTYKTGFKQLTSKSLPTTPLATENPKVVDPDKPKKF